MWLLLQKFSCIDQWGGLKCTFLCKKKSLTVLIVILQKDLKAVIFSNKLCFSRLLLPSISSIGRSSLTISTWRLLVLLTPSTSKARSRHGRFATYLWYGFCSNMNYNTSKWVSKLHPDVVEKFCIDFHSGFYSFAMHN